MKDEAECIWTFLPGLHGTSELFSRLLEHLPNGITAELLELPAEGPQDYDFLTSFLNDWLDAQLPGKRILIAESFSGPLALRLASQRRDEIVGAILAASFCHSPVSAELALLPIRPLFMIKPPKRALRHFLIGDDASLEDVQLLRQVIKNTPPSTLAKRVHTVLELDEEDNPLFKDELPMLFLQAQEDNLIPWEAQQKLEAFYPHADVHWIESPHLILQTHPEECAEQIVDFAKKHGCLPAAQSCMEV